MKHIYERILYTHTITLDLRVLSVKHTLIHNIYIYTYMINLYSIILYTTHKPIYIRTYYNIN